MASMVALEWEPIRRPDYHRGSHRDVVGSRLRYRGDRLQLNRWSRPRLRIGLLFLVFVGIGVLFELFSAKFIDKNIK